jgi:hypothetical protein
MAIERSRLCSDGFALDVLYLHALIFCCFISSGVEGVGFSVVVDIITLLVLRKMLQAYVCLYVAPSPLSPGEHSLLFAFCQILPCILSFSCHIVHQCISLVEK